MQRNDIKRHMISAAFMMIFAVMVAVIKRHK